SAGFAPALICLRASAAIFGPHGWSELGVEALIPGSGTVGLQPGEFVVDVRLPAPPPRSGGAYIRLSPQEASDRSVTGTGVILVMEEDLVTCCGARVVLGGTAGTTAFRPLEAERFLAGKRLDPAVVQEAATLAVRSVKHEERAGARLKANPLEAIAETARRTILEALARVHKAAA
ncbi:MAG TPA: hypothetical protein VEU07_06860, partial [Candidatus Acidoferrum sp.]|nr:hypothetical protein [Candidatus Acidoferrum sp.]